MSIKEVTALRRQGKYREALAMAEDDIMLVNNEWTQMSYFWCLYKVCTEELIPHGNSDEIKKLLSIMGGLIPTMKDDNDTGKRCYERLNKRSLPYADAVSRCDELSKTNPCAAYEELSKLPVADLDDSLHDSYGWVLYRYLVQVCFNGGKIDPSQLSESMNVYLGLHNVRPSLLHSMMLCAAVRYAKKHKEGFAFVKFFKAWDPQTLREEDWKGRTDKDGTTYRSTAEECASLCIEAVRSGMRDEETVKWVRAFYKKVIENTPADDNNMRNYAILCAFDKDKDKTREIYSKLVTRAGDKYYVWHEYARLVDDNDLKIGLLIKALNIGQNEDYVGKIRIDLARALIGQGFFASAEKEIDTVVSHYQKKGWRIPEICSALKTQCQGKQDIGAFDTEHYCNIADDFVYSSLPVGYGYVYNVKKEKKLLCIMDTQSRNLFYKCRGTKLKAGDFVMFRELGETGNNPRKIVTIKNVPASDVLPLFNSCTAVVDNVNEGKKLFHIVGIKKGAHQFMSLRYVSTAVRYADTSLRPAVGDMLSIVYGNKDENAIRVVDLKKCDTEDPRLSKIVEGTLRVMRKGEDDTSDGSPEPDYGFVDDMYVHKSVLLKHGITEGCNVTAKAVVSRDGRWSVYDIKRK